MRIPRLSTQLQHRREGGQETVYKPEVREAFTSTWAREGMGLSKRGTLKTRKSRRGGEINAWMWGRVGALFGMQVEVMVGRYVWGTEQPLSAQGKFYSFGREERSVIHGI